MVEDSRLLGSTGWRKGNAHTFGLSRLREVKTAAKMKQWRYNFLCRSEQFLLKMEPLVLKKEADVHATNCDDFISTINNDNADVVSVLPDNMIAVHQRREVVSVVQEQSTNGCKLLMS